MSESVTQFFGGGAELKKFDDPFILPSNGSFPSSVSEMLDLCVYLYYMNPQFQQATQRVVSHFLTDLDMEGDPDQDAKDTLYEDLTEKLNLFSSLARAGANYFCCE